MSDRDSSTESEEDDNEEEDEDEDEEEEDDDESGDDEDVDEEEEEEEAVEEEEDEEEEEEQEEEEEEEDIKMWSGEESDSSEQGSDEERDENMNEKRQTVIQEERESSESDSSTESEEEVQKKATETAKDKYIKEPIQSVTNLERKKDATESFNTDVTGKLGKNAKEPIEIVKPDSEVRSDATEPIKSVVTNSEVRAEDNTLSRESHPKVFQSTSQETQTDESSFVSKEIIQRNEGENLAPHKIVNEPTVPKPELTDAYSMTDIIERKNVETITETLPHLPKQGINQHVQTEEIPTLSPHVTSERSPLIQTENGGAVSQPYASLREEMAPVSSIDSHRCTSDKTVQVNYSDVTSFRRVRTQTKLKRYNVRTMTSGLIKRRIMQTCTSGLISKPEQKDRGTNTAGTALRSRGTQTKDKESVSKQEKNLIEREPQLPETEPSHKEVADEVTSKPSKKSRKAKVPKLKLTPDLDKNSNEAKVSRDLQQKPTPPESPTEKNSGSRDQEISGKEVENKKVMKERENARRRGRRRREFLFMPLRQSSLNWRPRPFPPRKPPPRLKSAKLLTKRKPVRPEGIPVSVARYRIITSEYSF